MRTTLTLDPDVAALAERMQRPRGENLQSLVNEALRRGLRTMDTPARLKPTASSRGRAQRAMDTPAPEPAPYKTPTVDLGRCLVDNLDDVATVLAVAEGEAFK